MPIIQNQPWTRHQRNKSQHKGEYKEHRPTHLSWAANNSKVSFGSHKTFRFECRRENPNIRRRLRHFGQYGYRFTWYLLLSSIGQQRLSPRSSNKFCNNIFNRRYNAAVIDILYNKKSVQTYFKQVIDYCVMGNLQAVLDEFAYMIDERSNGERNVETIQKEW